MRGTEVLKLMIIDQNPAKIYLVYMVYLSGTQTPDP